MQRNKIISDFYTVSLKPLLHKV